MTRLLVRCLALAVLLLGSSVYGQESGADSNPNEEGAVLSPEAFQSQCESAGGRVDFLFGEARPFASCHASTLVELPGGGLLCAWFGGTQEKADDVAIWTARFENGAWSTPLLAAKIAEIAHWNPVLDRVGDSVYLYFKVGEDPKVWSTRWQRSEDGGRTWSAQEELVPTDIGGRGPVKNKPIHLSDGAWLAPASTETKTLWAAFADRSEDQGKTWTRTEDWSVDKSLLKGIGAIQPTLWESEPGKVHALMRTGEGRIWRADSEDGGKSWGAVSATDLPNNNSGIDLLRLDDGRLLLVYNPVGKNWGPRTPLDLALSKDNGDTWTTIAHLEDDPDLKGEYSYPAIVGTSQGVAICYTWRRDRVRCWQFPLDALDGAE